MSRRRHIAVGALVGAALAGCAPQFDLGGADWTKADTQIQQVTLDEMECARLASRSYWTPESFVGGLADVVRVKIEDAQMSSAFTRCMESKGYRAARS
jgi:hypothetical protein